MFRKRYAEIIRSIRPVFCKKGVLKNFTEFTGKHLCQSPFFSKVAGLRPATLSKKRLWHRCFPVNFAKFLRNLFLPNTFGDCFWVNQTKFIFVHTNINSIRNKFEFLSTQVKGNRDVLMVPKQKPIIAFRLAIFLQMVSVHPIG